MAASPVAKHIEEEVAATNVEDNVIPQKQSLEDPYSSQILANSTADNHKDPDSNMIVDNDGKNQNPVVNGTPISNPFGPWISVRRNQRNNRPRSFGDRREPGDNNKSSRFQVLAEISEDEGSCEIGHDNMHAVHGNIKKDSETSNKHVQPKLGAPKKVGKRKGKPKARISTATMQKERAPNSGSKNKTVVTFPQAEKPQDAGASATNDPKREESYGRRSHRLVEEFQQAFS